MQVLHNVSHANHDSKSPIKYFGILHTASMPETAVPPVASQAIIADLS